MAGQVFATREEHIGWITFDHSSRRNAITLEMWQRIPDAVRAHQADDDVRVIVLRGAGEIAFVSGADISEFENARSASTAKAYDEATAAAFDALNDCPKPVIAMIHGFCVGGGVAIALTADLRYAADDAVFAVPAARLGLGYHWSGIAALVSTVGYSAAKEIFFTARRFDATEAAARHLVDAVHPKATLEGAVREIATRIADNAPLTIRSAKLAMRELSKPESARDAAAVEASIAACFESEDYREGVRAFLEKRRPAFRGK
jgi:enoyl-CoA hydratase/carnithine racemase